MRRLVIVQPYVPAYRVPFFDRLVDVLSDHGIECRIVAGEPDRVQAARRDAASAEWLCSAPIRNLKLAGRTLTLGGAAPYWKGSDGLIVGHLGSSLDTYRAIFAAPRQQISVGVWGHIRNYVNQPSRLDAALEKWQLGRVDHVFAYTRGGAEYALECGVDDSRITTVMNTIATDVLERERDRVGARDVDELKHRLGDPSGTVFAYVGGIDASKRIFFLAEALDQIWRMDPSIHLAVAGRGEQAHLLDHAVARGQVTMLGHADARQKAILGSVAAAILNPGRIGLLAVDSLVLGIPVITTPWPFHAPEAEYLVEGTSRLTAADDVHAYAAYVHRFSRSMKEGSLRGKGAGWSYPTLQDMVGNFAQGVSEMLADRGR